MNTTPHIPFEKLADLAETSSVAEALETQSRETAAHLATCAECASELHRLENVMTLMRTDREPDAPRDVLSYAVNLFAQRAQTRAPSALRRLVAALTFDSALNMAPAFGVRSGPSSSPGSQQLLFSAEDHDVELRVSAAENDWVVAGQLFGEDCAGGEVKLVKLDEASRAASAEAGVVQLNDLCEFILPPVAPGHYQLLVRLVDVEIEIPEFELIG